MIDVINLCTGYEKKQVLHNICVSFPKGKITVLIGPNGCGKSTLLKTFVRINSHTSGEIWIQEKSIESYSSNELAKQIAYLPQKKQTPDISVRRMVLHGRFPYLHYPRKYREEDIVMAKHALARVGLSAFEEENINRLSGGMQQNVYIAMALAQDTQTILLDEPTTYLDISHQLRLMKMMRTLADEGKTIIMVLHDLSQAFRVADKLVVLKEGKVLATGTPKQMYENKKHIITDTFDVEMERIETKTGWHYICEDI